MTAVFPRLVDRRDITSHMKRLAIGSIPKNGSSRITIGGFPIIAIATDNFRLFPPLRAKDGLLACFNRSNSTNFPITICPNSYSGTPLILA
nr:hypothetical protein Iba_chr14aCG14690 [Ipomoea batatas]GMD90524.1 hypothetical protein Iba_chr14dCG10490 [Ipomoea batatas]